MDVLLGDWNRAADMLFSIHPIDGSLLVWHVDWLDEYQPGMFRQAQVKTLREFVLPQIRPRKTLLTTHFSFATACHLHMCEPGAQNQSYVAGVYV